MDKLLPFTLLPEAIKPLLAEAASLLHSHHKRIFMAKTANNMGEGGQRRAESIFGWNRGTIRKGQLELDNGILNDQFHCRGRKPVESHLPNFLEDIRNIAEPQSHQDPTFCTTKVYCPLTAKSVRNELVDRGKYTLEQLPALRTIRAKLNDLNFNPEKVLKCKPKKKIKETDAIFEQIHLVNAQADCEPGVLRLSIDAKAAIKGGPFSRGGYSRRKNKANDHDFAPICILKLFGIFLPFFNRSFFFFTESVITPDFMLDCLACKWPMLKELYQVWKLVINLDNGPENNSHRTQFIKRIVEFSQRNQVEIQLAYYPPYHSKYNPIERLWGILENHWRGDLLESTATVYNFAQSMTYNGVHPEICVMPGLYNTGVTLSSDEMKIYEAQIERHHGLESWFVNIRPEASINPMRN